MAKSAFNRITDGEISSLARLKARFPHLSTRELGLIYGISSASVSYWLRKGCGRASTHRITPRRNAESVDKRRKLLKRLVMERRRDEQPRYPSAPSLMHALARKNIKVSKQTVLRDLYFLGFWSVIRPKVCAYEADHEVRLAFCRRMRSMSTRHFAFSDEKIFTTNDDGHRFQWVQEGERPRTRLKSRWPTGRVMVWAIIGIGFRHLVILPMKKQTDEGDVAFRLTACEYVRRCLSPVVPQLLAGNFVLMQDGAACHTAASTKSYLARKGVPILDRWPPRSPDLNPIETMWAIMAREVSLLSPTDNASLVAAIRRVWNAMPMSTTDKLVLSFPRRVRSVISKNGSM